MDAGDRLDVIDLLHRYAHVYDEGRLPDLGALFTPDAVFTFRPGIGGMPDVLDGRAAIVEHMRRRHEATQPAQRRHLVTNVTLLEPGDGRARVGSYLLLASTAGGALTLPVTGRYEDVVVRDGGAWRFASRVLTLDAALA